MLNAAKLAGLAALIAVMSPWSASAETISITPTPPPPPPNAQGQSQPGMLPSRAVGRTHDCATFFPVLSRHLREEGNVLVGYDVDANGVIRNVRVVKSSGFARLDDAAVLCVSTVWLDTPATMDGKPVASPGHQAVIEFRMEMDSAEDYLVRGLGREARGDYDGAIADFTTAITMEPQNAAGYRARSAAYDATGQRELARADFAKAASLTPPKSP
jgi:TonB family protein